MKFALSRIARTRLLKLADYMESLPKQAAEHFMMDEWYDHNALFSEAALHHHVAVDEQIKAEHLTMCGTVACAAGWACTSPYFNKLGLTMHKAPDGVSVRFKDHSATDFCVFDVLMEAFDIDIEAAYYFFRDIDARSPREWARKARGALK